MTRMIDDFRVMYPVREGVTLPDSVDGGFAVCRKFVDDPMMTEVAKERLVIYTVQQFPKRFCYATNFERDLERYDEFVFQVNMMIDNYHMGCAPYELG